MFLFDALLILAPVLCHFNPFVFLLHVWLQFVRYRRWSCMNELRLQVEKQLKENENYGRQSFIKKLPPYPFPAKSRLFKNKSTVAGKD